MQSLYINGRDMGKISARRYTRVNLCGTPYNDWHFAMAGGYEIHVAGIQFKRFWQTVINRETVIEIITYTEE